MLENLLNSISDNPAYLAVAIVLITMITFSVIKKLFKIVTLGITLFILYCAYLLFTNQPLPNMDEIKTQLENSEEKIGIIKKLIEIKDFNWNNISNSDNIFKIDGPFKWAKGLLFLSVLNILVGLYFIYLANILNKLKEDKRDMTNHVALLFSLGVLMITYHSFLWVKNSVDLKKYLNLNN